MTIAEKLTAIAENEQKVYTAGQEQGKQEAYDEFWDSLQENGERKSYAYAFAYWKTDQFKPKYDIVPTTSAIYTFLGFGADSATYIDFVEFLESRGITLDLKGAISVEGMFASNKIWRLGVIDVTGCTTTGALPFKNATNLTVVDKLIVNNSLNLSGLFANNSYLQDIVFEGTISSGYNLSWAAACMLTHDSLMSIINALEAYTGTSTRKITLGSTNLARLSEDEKAQIEAKGWTYA